ncbi:MAG: rhodanese-like domain-containing protein [Wenzhouxiangella sp.]|nr:rhodanese-like domain-containing protein [Wenzhouxiangella sp.]TVR94878.1 MAG: rhodanese-like domain-containing protein [Wenzhouxiangellaceae bacterium]
MNIMAFKLSLVFAALMLAIPPMVAAGERVTTMGAFDAWQAVEQGEALLVDIRQPEEWAQTGMARNAIGISMLHPEGQQGFLRDLVTATGGRLDAPVVLICRTGNRTSQVRQALESMGFTNVSHIPEGMIGSRAGPGWIASDLPVDPCRTC